MIYFIDTALERLFDLVQGILNIVGTIAIHAVLIKATMLIFGWH